MFIIKGIDRSDAEYVRQIQCKSNKVTEEFYYNAKKYFKNSYKSVFSRLDLMDDIFQQSFVKLWIEIETQKIFVGEDDKLFRYDRNGKVRLLTCNLNTFLIDIAKNDYRAWLRNDCLALDEDFESFAHMQDVREAMLLDGQDDMLREQTVYSCVLELPPRCKEILTMFYYDGLSLDEILEARDEKNISKNGLKTAKYKCMENLKAKVKNSFARLKLKW